MTDGDTEIDPLTLLKGFFKALAIEASFPTLYGWMATIIEDMTNKILILRIGLPLACSGLVDSDGGDFRTYIQKFFQSTLAVLIQIVLAKPGVGLMLNLHVFLGIAALMLAIKTPRFLRESIIVSGGSGNPMRTAYSGIRLVQIAKGAFKK